MSESGIAPAGTVAGLEGKSIIAGTVAAIEGRSPEALASLYNAPHRRRARAETAKSMIGPGERPQEIYTPQILIDAIMTVWGEIAFDPCSGPQSLVPAKVKAYVPASTIATGKFNKDGSPKTKVVYTPGPGDIDGLTVQWPDFAYSNPPFALLMAWMRKAAKEACENNPHTEIMQLVPVRTHRKWWRNFASTTDRVCWLDPVHFVGYKSGFPAPLAMLYWGDCPSTFTYAFYGLGDVREF